MSKYIEQVADSEDTVISLDDPNKCYWMYNEVCCHEKSRLLADYPTANDCSKCSWFKRETFKGKPKISRLF